MHVISRKILREYCQNHADSCVSLDDWYKTAQQASWINLIGYQLKTGQPTLKGF